MMDAIYEEKGVRDVHVTPEAYEWYKKGRFGAIADRGQGAQGSEGKS